MTSKLPGDPLLAPGVSQRELDGPKAEREYRACDKCGDDVPAEH